MRIAKYAITAVLATAMLFNVAGIFKRLVLQEQVSLVLGYGNAVVVSGSMEPTISRGDMIIIHRQPAYQVGDIVTYTGNNTPTTHRVIEVVPGGYITKGDANNTSDGVIEPDRLVGRVVHVIPHVGSIAGWLQTPQGMLMLVAAAYMAIEAPSLVLSKRERTREGMNRPTFAHRATQDTR